MISAQVATGSRRQLDFDDNALVQRLYGPHDAHLARIEAELHVTLITRGNRITVIGEEDAISLADTVLRLLWRRLRGGLEVDIGDVDAALRSATLEGAPPETAQPDMSEVRVHTRRRVITPRNTAQANYLRAMAGAELVIGLGPAGTGKTYLAVAHAVAMMAAGEIGRLVLSRPAVEAGERLGFLPGDMKEKVDPYLRPLYDAIYDMMPADQVARRLVSGEIEVAPLAFMRGRTLSNAFVIVDEAQNTTPMQMKMVLTRLGEGARMVVVGDPSQTDLPRGQRSGLDDALEVVSGLAGVMVVRFDERDVVRHPLVGRIVCAYELRDRQQSGMP